MINPHTFIDAGKIELPAATVGISINPNIGLGDTIQFSSLPENYFHATGKCLIDVSKSWIFDYNPYVIRDPEKRPLKTVELWNFGHKNKFEWKNPRPDMPAVYTSNAEIWATALGVTPIVLNRPRLYIGESYPFADRHKILFHVDGRSHGIMPRHVIEHVLNKYRGCDLYQIGTAADIDLGIPRIETPTVWDLVRVISQARMLIGMDSGPSWIAACYPDVVVKKLRTTPKPERFQEWIPLEIRNIHAHWDDRCHQIFNPTERDIGFTTSYLKM